VQVGLIKNNQVGCMAAISEQINIRKLKYLLSETTFEPIQLHEAAENEIVKVGGNQGKLQAHLVEDLDGYLVGQGAEVHCVYTVQDCLRLDALLNESEMNHLGLFTVLLGWIVISLVFPNLVVESIILQHIHALRGVINYPSSFLNDGPFHEIDVGLALTLVAFSRNAKGLSLQDIVFHSITSTLAVLGQP
jgi:hypothetical protein